MDVNLFVPNESDIKRRCLLENIIGTKGTTEFSVKPRPIIIVPALLTAGNLSISNVQQFMEKGVYTEDEKANP